MKKVFTAIALASSLMFAGSASADVLTYDINDIMGGTAYTIAATGVTYTGTGYLGMYQWNEFGHLFGLEGQMSRTNSQVDISALKNKKINSATLTFVLEENHGTGGTLSITGYNSNGTLGYRYEGGTADYGVVTGSLVNGQGAKQSYDVTSLLAAAVSTGEDWLGLHFANSESGRWTYSSVWGYATDRAKLQLTVDASAVTAEVPEPAPLALMGLAIGGLLLARRRKQA